MCLADEKLSVEFRWMVSESIATQVPCRLRRAAVSWHGGGATCAASQRLDLRRGPRAVRQACSEDADSRAVAFAGSVRGAARRRTDQRPGRSRSSRAVLRSRFDALHFDARGNESQRV